jgi:hypothetical protein
MTRIDPNPMSGDEISRGVAQGRHLPVPTISDAQLADYEQRTYEVLVRRGVPTAEAQWKANWWARLKATDTTGETVIGPADNPLARLDQPRIETDPITGRQTYKGSFQAQPQAALGISSASVGSPPIMLEYTRNQWIGMQTPVNRFSINPGAEYYAAIPGTPPTMFGVGDLPIITGSGVDPSVLRWVAWPLRHSAAFTSSRADVAIMIELSMIGDPEAWQNDQDLQNEAGRQSLNDYWARVFTWVNTLPADGNGLGDLTPEEIARFYPDGPSSE